MEKITQLQNQLDLLKKLVAFGFFEDYTGITFLAYEDNSVFSKSLQIKELLTSDLASGNS